MRTEHSSGNEQHDDRFKEFEKAHALVGDFAADLLSTGLSPPAIEAALKVIAAQMAYDEAISLR